MYLSHGVTVIKEKYVSLNYMELFLTLETNKLCVPQVFFVIHLHAGPVINTLPPIMDPDPLLTCDLMDGRDAFLTLARDKHWEFSSLRRCKWSTMCMLVELHNQGQDRFVYTCNECKHHVETRWHCTVCEVKKTLDIINVSILFIYKTFHLNDI